jgi:hypothetical protein
MSFLRAAVLAAATAAPGSFVDRAAWEPTWAADGWTRSEAPRRFGPDTLYNHIDGGAELFLELGFEELLVERLNRGDAEVSIELYRMSDVAAALGVYLEKRGRETAVAGVSGRSSGGPLQVLLQRGRHVAVFSNLSGGTAEASSLSRIAGRVASTLPDEADPQELALLPAEGRWPGSERIVRGPVGLQGFVTLGDGDVLLLSERSTAVAARYGDPSSADSHSLLIAEYASEAEAVAALDHVAAHLDPRVMLLGRTATALCLQDHAGRPLDLTRRGRRMELRHASGLAPATPVAR